MANSSNSRDVFSTPRSYTPDGANLTRRPLGTPHRPAAKVNQIQSTTSSTTAYSSSAAKKSSAKSWGIPSYCRYLLPVLLVLVLLLFLVYYHMEEGKFKELTGWLAYWQPMSNNNFFSTKCSNLFSGKLFQPPIVSKLSGFAFYVIIYFIGLVKCVQSSLSPVCQTEC